MERNQESTKYLKLFVSHRMFLVSEATLSKIDDTYFTEKIISRTKNNNQGETLDDEMKRDLDEDGNMRKKDIVELPEFHVIERDGTHFEAILNHLRGCLNLEHWSERHLHELAEEARFYRLDQLTSEIDTRIEWLKFQQNRLMPMIPPRDRIELYFNQESMLKVLIARGRPTFTLELTERAEAQKSLTVILRAKLDAIYFEKYDLSILINNHNKIAFLLMFFDPNLPKYELVADWDRTKHKNFGNELVEQIMRRYLKYERALKVENENSIITTIRSQKHNSSRAESLDSRVSETTAINENEVVPKHVQTVTSNLDTN